MAAVVPGVPVVTRAEEALRSLGVCEAGFDRREVDAGSWFADWSGELAASDVYIGLMGAPSAGGGVRLLLDDWTFDGVAAADLGPLLTDVFSGRASITHQRSLLIFSVQVLAVSVNGTPYSAARRFQRDERLSGWERRLLAA